MSRASNVTVVHLIKVTNAKKISTARLSLSTTENKGEPLTELFNDPTIWNTMIVCR